MKYDKNYIYWFFLSLFVFYICWGFPQISNTYGIIENKLFLSTFFSIVYTGLAGCLLPILLINKFDIKANTSDRILTKSIIGYLFLIITLVFTVFFSNALSDTLSHNYSPIIYIKYVLLFFPMSLALSLYGFILIPALFQQMNNKLLKAIFTVISTGLFFALGFFIDSSFGSIELAITLSIIGLMLSIANILIKNFWVVFVGFFIIMLFNTLGEAKYIDNNIYIVIASSLLSGGIMFYHLAKRKAV